MWKKVFSVVGVIIFLGGGYFAFDRYTASYAFVKKDVDTLNSSYSLSGDEFQKACESMSLFSHVDGLTDGALTPFGGKTYYYRSSCYQELARKTTNESFCANVRERWTLLGDGSGVSKAACRRQVEQASETRSQIDTEAKQRDEQRQLFIESNPMKITKTWVETLADDQYRVNVQVEGSLFGRYRFEVKAHSLNKKYNPIIEDSLLQVNSKILSWIIKKSDIASESDVLPKIVPISVLLTHIDSAQDTSIGNTSISIE